MSKNFIKAGISLFAAASLLLSACGAQGASGNRQNSNGETKTIRIATSGGPAPYITSDDQGKVGGYDVEVLNAVFDKLPQYKSEYVRTEFASVLTGVQAGNYDIALNNLSYNPERAKSFLYSFPYDKVSYVYVQKKGEEPINSLSDAGKRGLKTSLQAGTNVANAVENYNKNNPNAQISIEYTDADLTLQLQNMLNGSLDFIPMDLAMYSVYAERLGTSELQYTDMPADEASGIQENLYSYYLFASNNDALRQEINKALKELKEDGTITKIAQKYFGADTAPEADQYEKTIN